MITENLSTLKIHKLTQEQYERELAAGNIDPNALYLTPDEAENLSEYVTIDQLNDSIDAISVPTKVSELTNDAGYIIGYTETDPTVPSWAKAPSKPTYTASEVGALPNTTVVPDALSDLTEDSTHRTVTDSEKTAWNAKADSEHEHAATDITSGTLSVARGGTGATTFASGNALIGAGTGAITTRAITNNTSTSGSISANTNLITSNTLRYALNRTTSVAAADTNYTTYMARGESLNSSETTPTLNGTIAWMYE